MNLFHTTSYELYNKNNIKLFIMSDIHFDKNIKNKKLNKILKYVSRVKPDYILIPGDLIDSVHVIEEELEKNRILNWVEELSKISKTIISIGNHDYYYKIDNNKKGYNDNKKFFKELNSIKNVYLLDNEVYEDDRVYIVGFTVRFSFYHQENVNILIEDLDKNKKILNPKCDKLKILLSHSPEYLNNEEVYSRINKFDYIISGHMHNGCVPPIIIELWKSTRGIVNPAKELFRKNTRNLLYKKEDKLLINGPITTFSKMAGIFRILNFIFPMYVTIMNFNNTNNFKRKRKYHRK